MDAQLIYPKGAYNAAFWYISYYNEQLYNTTLKTVVPRGAEVWQR